MFLALILLTWYYERFREKKIEKTNQILKKGCFVRYYGGTCPEFGQFTLIIYYSACFGRKLTDVTNHLVKNETSITNEFNITHGQNTFKFYYQTPYGSTHESNEYKSSKLKMNLSKEHSI